MTVVRNEGDEMKCFKRVRALAGGSLCCLLVCSTLCISGCSAIREFQDDPMGVGKAQEASNQEFEDYMASTYGDKFTYVKSSQTAGLFGESSACYMLCDSIPDAYIRVEKAKTDGGYVFYDGYLSARYRDSVVALAEEANNETFGNRSKVAVYTDGTQFSSEGCGPDTSLDEYIDKNTIFLTFYFDAGQSYDRDADINAIVGVLASKGVKGYVHMYYLDTAQFATVPQHQTLVNGEADLVSFDDRVAYGWASMTDEGTLEEVTWDTDSKQ